MIVEFHYRSQNGGIFALQMDVDASRSFGHIIEDAHQIARERIGQSTFRTMVLPHQMRGTRPVEVLS